jgi:trimethylamine--corrinoid protein Co-methyltransferase
MRVNYKTYSGTQFKVLSDDQVEAIYLAALEVLEDVGVRVHSPEARELLLAAGATVSSETLVKIPPYAVKRALESAPSRIVAGNRNGERVMALQENNVYYGTVSDCPFIIDSASGERRQYVFADVANAARIIDAMPNIDFFMSLGLVSDVPRFTYDVHQFHAMVSNTVKPMVITAVDKAGLADIYEMCCVIAGSEEAFHAAPFIILYAEPTSPLTHTPAALAKLLFAADKMIPTVYTPCVIGGATAPATMAGCLVEALAECLSGLVIAQQRKPGAPIIMGGVPSIMDMRTMILSYGAPELSLLSAAFTDVIKWLKLPVFSNGGCSDSKTVDQQAAIESAISILMATLSGANLIHDVGLLEAGLVGSYELVVMSDEIIGMAKRIARGIRVDEETLATEVIKRVGPGGQFLDDEHTLKHFRDEFWFPGLMDRNVYDNWAASGAKTMGERISELTATIIEKHCPEPLPKDVAKEVEDVVARADARLDAF